MFFNKIKRDGSTKEQAIIINAPNERTGVDAEYKYLESIYGKQNVEWRLNEQGVTMYRKRFYDIIKIKFRNGQKRTFWFDINAFYEGKDE